MKKLPLFFALSILLALLVVPPAGFAQRTSKAPAARATVQSQRYAAQLKIFDAFVRSQMKLDKTPGLTIGFFKDDFEWVKGYGYSDLENKLPAHENSAYRLASVSKSMTAVAIMQLVEQGKIDLDAEVQTYVSYFPKKKWPVTVRQLLGHLGGISHYKNPAQELHIKEAKTTREAIAIFQDFDLIAEPGTRYSYTSYGYNLLGAIVEAASGMSFGEYMTKNVWAPLGMKDTRLDSPVDLIPHRVRGYRLMNGEVKNSEFVDISSRFGGGGTRSTIPDLLRYGRGIIAGKLLSRNNGMLMATSMKTKEGRLTNYGMGWDTAPQSGRFVLAHSGAQQETLTLLYLVPERNMGFAIGMNFENGSPGIYVERLFQLVTGAPRNIPAYSADKRTSALSEAINAAFNYGMGYFERTSHPLASTDAELDEAFQYFSASVKPEAFAANQQDALKRIRDGVHPLAKEAYVKVGSYMAAKLKGKLGPGQLQSYSSLGGPIFFRDYIALTEKDPSLRKFEPEFTQAATSIARDWSRTNTEFVRTLWLTPEIDLIAAGRTLRQTFQGAATYPSLSDPLFTVTRTAVFQRNLPLARTAGQLAMDLYPEAAAANFAFGMASLLSGEQAVAMGALKKSATLNPNGAASAGGLNNAAYQLAGAGMVDEAMTVLRAAIELHPKEANLHDSLGEFQLRKGEKDKALESYRKALELNPDFPNAANAREMVKKLSGSGGK